MHTPGHAHRGEPPKYRFVQFCLETFISLVMLHPKGDGRTNKSRHRAPALFPSSL